MSAGVLSAVHGPSHSAVLSVRTATLSWSFRTPPESTYSGVLRVLPNPPAKQAQEPHSLGFWAQK